MIAAMLAGATHIDHRRRPHPLRSLPANVAWFAWAVLAHNISVWITDRAHQPAITSAIDQTVDPG